MLTTLLLMGISAGQWPEKQCRFGLHNKAKRYYGSRKHCREGHPGFLLYSEKSFTCHVHKPPILKRRRPWHSQPLLQTRCLASNTSRFCVALAFPSISKMSRSIFMSPKNFNFCFKTGELLSRTAKDITGPTFIKSEKPFPSFILMNKESKRSKGI